MQSFLKYFNIKKSNIISVLAITLITSCNEDKITYSPDIQSQSRPFLIEPTDNSNSLTSSPLLIWGALRNTVSYKVQVSLDANFAGIMIADTLVSDTLLQLANQSYWGNYYYWRVKAIYHNNHSPWSEVWRFRLLLAPPDPPQLLSPPDNSVIQTYIPQFQWTSSDGAETYRIQISANNLFNQLVLDSSGILLVYLNCPELILNSGRSYFWRVNASNSNGFSVGNWSAVFGFATPHGVSPFTISGKVRFVESNFVKAEYRIYLFDKWENPAQQVPVSSLVIKTDSLVNNEYSYTFSSVRSGSYYLATGVNKFLPSQTAILGIYGCDTIHLQYSSCPLNPPPAAIIKGQGLENINFLSWADTSKRIF
jgi:hypothetical protein